MTDKGDILFDTNFQTGMITISVREPLAIDKRKAEISILDFLEVSAQVQLEMVQESRKVAAHLAKTATGKPA